jgi:hypothetical protein
MARVAKSTKIAKATTRAHRTGRPTAKAAKTTAKAKLPSAKKAAAAKRTSTAPAVVAKASKDDLRGQVAKLERSNALLRTRNRDTNRALKAAETRVAELETQVARLEKQLAAQTPAARRSEPVPTSAPKSGRRAGRRAIDPGDAVPPGVAVEEPAPLDLEAESERENLEQHPGGEPSNNDRL